MEQIKRSRLPKLDPFVSVDTIKSMMDMPVQCFIIFSFCRIFHLILPLLVYFMFCCMMVNPGHCCK